MGTATITYRCPSCRAPCAPGLDRCPSCGFAPDTEDQTWIVDASEAPPAARHLGRFEDRYDLMEEIGRGGMGIVYKAIDRELDEVIALKALAPAAGANPELVARFKHEVKVARRLTHPNIARLHDLLEVRGQLCLSMEYIEGRSLRAVLDDEKRLEPARVLRYLRYIVPALDLAHGRGIVHRDLKPGNLVIDPKDVPHILDFGIAKSQWIKETDESPLVGTPAYMAPEQWKEGKVDGRADIYSLGILLYEMLCGRRPFEHRNRLLLMEMHLNRVPEPPSRYAPGLSRGLESAILRCLEKAPERRFARAGDLLEAIEPGPPAARRRTGEARRPADVARGAIPPVSLMPGKKGKVLVVDDEPGVRRVVGAQLKQRDLVAVDAGDGRQALEAAFRELPDLILLDVGMPVLDGVEVLRVLKSDPRTIDVPVVVMSGRADHDQVVFLKESGAASFLKKPVSAEVLDLVLERFFA